MRSANSCDPLAQIDYRNFAYTHKMVNGIPRNAEKQNSFGNGNIRAITRNFSNQFLPEKSLFDSLSFWRYRLYTHILRNKNAYYGFSFQMFCRNVRKFSVSSTCCITYNRYLFVCLTQITGQEELISKYSLG
jgi:hypothetical protein